MVSSAIRTLIVLFLASSSFGAVALEGSFGTQNKVGVKLDSMAIATTTGSNRLLVVMTTSENGTDNLWLTGIDYGTRASPTALVFAGRTKAGGAAFTEIWYATDATIAGAGEDSIYFTWSATACTSCEVIASYSMWSGVDQTELVTDGWALINSAKVCSTGPLNSFRFSSRPLATHKSTMAVSNS